MYRCNLCHYVGEANLFERMGKEPMCPDCESTNVGEVSNKPKFYKFLCYCRVNRTAKMERFPCFDTLVEASSESHAVRIMHNDMITLRTKRLGLSGLSVWSDSDTLYVLSAQEKGI